MKLIFFHDMNNPNQRIPMDANDFSVAVPLGSGSAIRVKSSDEPILVTETVDEISNILEKV